MAHSSARANAGLPASFLALQLRPRLPLPPLPVPLDGMRACCNHSLVGPDVRYQQRANVKSYCHAEGQELPTRLCPNSGLFGAVCTRGPAHACVCGRVHRPRCKCQVQASRRALPAQATEAAGITHATHACNRQWPYMPGRGSAVPGAGHALLNVRALQLPQHPSFTHPQGGVCAACRSAAEAARNCRERERPVEAAARDPGEDG